MSAFTGNSGDNTIHGTTSDDTFDMSQGGADTVFGDNGADIFDFGNTFTLNDSVHGGNGYDILKLSGASYAAGLAITSAQLVGVQEIQLGTGHSYTLSTGDQVVEASHQLFVNGYALGANNSLNFDGSAETNGTFQLAGGLGDDTLVGGAKADWIYSGPVSSSGGDDTLQGNGGNDIFLFGGDLTNADRVDGGNGNDGLVLDGDYSHGFTFDAGTLTSVEEVTLDDFFSYTLATTDAIVAAGKTFLVDASQVSASYKVKFDGSAETDGKFIFQDSYGNDVFTGGAGADQFTMLAAGNDILNGGDGKDTFDFLTGSFDVFDKINGGVGYDTLILWGTDTPSVNLSNLTSIENITLYGGAFTYQLNAPDALVPAGHQLTVNGFYLGGGGVVDFDGSKETDGTFSLTGGIEADMLTGGALNDSLRGHGGGDTLKGGTGNDTYVYAGVTDSTDLNYDTIIGFNADHDKFSFIQDITAVDATIHGGTLTTANFENDLAAAVNGHLNATHAILFEPTNGNLAGTTFLIVDGNGIAGYQNGSVDFVIQLESATHLADLNGNSFI